MRHFPTVLLAVMLMVCAGFGQTGFTTQTYPLPHTTDKVTAADFNGDGKADLLSYGNNGSYVLLNNGNGTFGTPIQLPSAATESVAVGDINKDGSLDLVTCNVNASTNQYSLVTYLNDGSGHFSVGQTIPLVGTCTSVNVWDINQDGTLDVVTTATIYNGNGTYTDQTNVWFNQGGGNLSTVPVTQTYNLDDPNGQSNGEFGCQLGQAVLADFYKDPAHPGIMLFGDCNGSQGPINTGTVWIAQSSGDGHFGGLVEIQNGGTGYGNGSYPKALDINLDGKPDVLTVSQQNGPHGSDNSTVFAVINNGAPNFTWTSAFSASAYAGSGSYNNAATAQADFNGDGFGDIASAYNQTRSDFSGNDQFIQILNGSSSAGFTRSQQWDLGDTMSILVSDMTTADFNNDGRPDLAVLTYSQTTGQSKLYVYLNTQGSVACAPPSSPGVNVCAPQNNGTYSSPVQFTAAGTGQSGSVQRMELWIDGNKVNNYFSSVVNASVPLSNGQHVATFVEVDSTGAYLKSPDINITVGSSGGGGNCNPSQPGATICSPAPNANVSSPVNISAGATAQSGYITAIRIYLDNASVATVNNPSQSNTFSINQAINVGPGAHNLVIVGYQSNGGAVTVNETINVGGGGGGGGCVPSGTGARICSPANGANTSNTVDVQAGANAAAGTYITAIRVYVDGVEAAFQNNPSQSASFQIDQNISVSQGSHNLVVVGYQSDGNAQVASVNFTTGGGGSCSAQGPGVVICSPASGQTVNAPFTVSAATQAASGYTTAMRIYLDDQPVATVNNPNNSPSFSISQSVSAGSGTHHLVVVGYDSNGGAQTSGEYVTVP